MQALACLIISAIRTVSSSKKNSHAGGHVHTEQRNGFLFDEGPHISFSKHEYVRKLFAESVSQEYEEFRLAPVNYFQKSWIDHPVQANLYQVPEPLRSKCIRDFVAACDSETNSSHARNYQQWLLKNFGHTLVETFHSAYTRKYWTVEPKDLNLDWIGTRIFTTNRDTVLAGAKGKIEDAAHYIQDVRYPRNGGYFSYAKKLLKDAPIRLNSQVERISLKEKKVWLSDGECIAYDKLANTIPLPVFVMLCCESPPNVIEAARTLSCSSILLVNVTAPHVAQRKENLIYVYDPDKYTSRIHFTERYSASNAPTGHTGIQAEVYFSKYKPLEETVDAISHAVLSELRDMKLLLPDAEPQKTGCHTKIVPFANVIFDHNRKPALKVIFDWLEKYGLQRSDAELDAGTSWDNASYFMQENNEEAGLVLCGRFGEWKYYWSDDCVMSGRHCAKMLGEQIK